MRWNPRRFVAAALEQAVTVDGQIVLTPRQDAGESGVGNTPVRLVWLTADVIERIDAAARTGALDLTGDPFPDEEALIIGFAQPQRFGAGDAAFTLVPAFDAQVHTNRLFAARLHPERSDAEHQESAWREAQSGMRTGYHFDSRGTVLGTASVGPPLPPMLRSADSAAQENLLRQLQRQSGTAPATAKDAARMNTLVRAAWTLMSTPLEREVTATVAATQQVSVGKKRRARDYPVSMIDVRRAPSARCLPSGRRVEHDHRWAVRGHWRNQACGPGRSLRRRVWIDGYVAGPEDKPLRVRPKVNVIRHVGGR